MKFISKSLFFGLLLLILQVLSKPLSLPSSNLNEKLPKKYLNISIQEKHLLVDNKKIITISEISKLYSTKHEPIITELKKKLNKINNIDKIVLFAHVDIEFRILYSVINTCLATVVSDIYFGVTDASTNEVKVVHCGIEADNEINKQKWEKIQNECYLLTIVTDSAVFIYPNKGTTITTKLNKKNTAVCIDTVTGQPNIKIAFPKIKEIIENIRLSDDECKDVKSVLLAFEDEIYFKHIIKVYELINKLQLNIGSLSKLRSE